MKMNELLKTALTVVLLIAATFLAAGCGNASGSAGTTGAGAGDSARPITIVATTAMIADVVRHVAGEHAEVTSLMGEGVDPHLYRPTRDDINRLLDADLVFYNGLNLEGKMGDAFVQVARSGKPVYAVTEELDPEYLLAPPEFAGHYDPHVWMDPKGWIRAAEVVADALREHDPDHAEAFAANANAYVERLEALDRYAAETLATIPEESRVLVTAHDAFNYFARAYGLEVRGIQGISTDSEAGLRKIEGLVDLIVDRKVRAVFTESSVPRKNVEALVRGARSKGHEVVIGGELFSDAMGEPGTYEGTYEGMIDHNFTTIVRALGGEAPERGLNGKLSPEEG